MRKYIPLIFVIFFSLSAHAQSMFFQPQFRQVTSRIDGISKQEQFYHYKLNGDTLFNGKLFQRLCSADPGVSSHCKQSIYGEYLADSSGFIYYHMNNLQFPVELLYDFNLDVGDTFKTYRLSEELRLLIVDSVKNIIVSNGIVRKGIFLHDLIYSSMKFRWVYGLGDIDRGWRYSGDFEGGQYRLVCHMENGNNIYHHSSYQSDCLYYFGEKSSSTRYVNEFDVNIFPNPTDGILNLEGIKNMSNIEIYSIDGKRMLSYIKGNQLDFSSYTSGIYLIRIENLIYRIYFRK